LTDTDLPVALAKIADEIDAARGRVLGLVADTPQAQAYWQPSTDAWSIAEVLDHLIRAEEGSARLIAGLAKRATASPPYPDGLIEFAWHPPTSDERWNVMVPDPAAAPSFGRPVADLGENLLGQGVLTRRALARLTEFDPRAVTFAHVLIPEPMNLAQWGRFIAYHLRVHARQIEDLKLPYRS